MEYQFKNPSSGNSSTRSTASLQQSSNSQEFDVDQEHNVAAVLDQLRQHEETILALQSSRECDLLQMQSMREQLDSLHLEREKSREWQRIQIEQSQREAKDAKRELQTMEDALMKNDLEHFGSLIEQDAPMLNGNTPPAMKGYIECLQTHLARALQKMQMQQLQIQQLKKSKEQMIIVMQNELDDALCKSQAVQASFVSQLNQLTHEKESMQKHYAKKLKQRDNQILELSETQSQNQLFSAKKQQYFVLLQKQVHMHSQEKHELILRVKQQGDEIESLQKRLEDKSLARKLIAESVKHNASSLKNRMMLQTSLSAPPAAPVTSDSSSSDESPSSSPVNHKQRLNLETDSKRSSFWRFNNITSSTQIQHQQQDDFSFKPILQPDRKYYKEEEEDDIWNPSPRNWNQ